VPATWNAVHPAVTPGQCFADEIAIDFPAVGHLVERERDAFLGEQPEILTTEVSLSSRDAVLGVVVGLDVPLRGTCPACGGRGEVWAEPCGECLGAGAALVRRPVRVPLPPGAADGARFRFRVSAPDAPSVRIEVRVAII
jgi:hypothetical protein